MSFLVVTSHPGQRLHQTTRSLAMANLHWTTQSLAMALSNLLLPSTKKKLSVKKTFKNHYENDENENENFSL